MSRGRELALTMRPCWQTAWGSLEKGVWRPGLPGSGAASSPLGRMKILEPIYCLTESAPGEHTPCNSVAASGQIPLHVGFQPSHFTPSLSSPTDFTGEKLTCKFQFGSFTSFPAPSEHTHTHTYLPWKEIMSGELGLLCFLGKAFR